MKKNVLLISMIAVLSLVGCGKNNPPSEEKPSEAPSSSEVTPAPSSEATSKASNQQSSSQASSQQVSSSKAPSSVEPPDVITGANFTVSIPKDLSMMSWNCKMYVDDMRAQQKKLLQEKGANADYYLNDLYGTSGVDITKGITEGDNGGYRPANLENDYLDDVKAEWEKGEKSDENKGITISFEPSEALKNKQYTFSYGLKEDLSDAKEINTNETEVCLKNLLVNQKYYFKVAAEGSASETLNFTTGDYPRWIDARPMFNVRDHGGYMTSSGKRIKQGMVYRGGEITPAVNWKSGMQYTGDVGGRYTDSNGRMQDGHITSQTAASKEVFRNVMGMVNGLEIDLRSSSERNNYTACGFAEGGDISYSLISISSYDNGMKNNKTQIKQVFEAFAQADQHPVYYHCYGGADRTGVVGFMLGALLGMSYTDLVIDFELTTYSSNPSRNYRSHLRAGPYNYWPRMVTYLQNTLGWNSSKTMAQSIEQFLVNDCKVSQTTINKIREIMLED